MSERDERSGATRAPGEPEPERGAPAEEEPERGRSAGPTPEEAPELLGERSDYPIAWEPEDGAGS